MKNKVTLNIVGDGELRKDLEELAKKKKLKNVIFHGRKEGRELINFYKSADMFLLVSNYECLSLVLLEAMATGTPIIASDIPGTRLIIKNNYNGILVKQTPRKIAEAIENLIKNPRLSENLARNGLKHIKKYSWDKIVTQTEQVYREVLEEHNKN